MLTLKGDVGTTLLKLGVVTLRGVKLVTSPGANPNECAVSPVFSVMGEIAHFTVARSKLKSKSRIVKVIHHLTDQNRWADASSDRLRVV